MSWIRKILGLCVHHWELMSSYRRVRTSDNQIVCHVYVMRCTHCGETKQEFLR